ncbi:MAG: peptide-methionine (S)-S-oxide reductase [Planctomycetota bacterium]
MSIGDHIESIAIDFDPSVIGYSNLLEMFWQSHSPCSPAYKRQYMSAIFCHDEAQKQLAVETKRQVAERFGMPVQTEIMDSMPFFLAEDYHQKYRLRRHGDLAAPLIEAYPDLRDFVDSTSATRLNGYVGGYGAPADFDRELPLLGLSERAQHILKTKIRR